MSTTTDSQFLAAIACVLREAHALAPAAERSAVARGDMREALQSALLLIEGLERPDELSPFGSDVPAGYNPLTPQ